MSNPKLLKTGTQGVKFSLENVDNAVSVEINPDGPQGDGKLGWSRVFAMNNSGYAANSATTVDLQGILQQYKEGGAKNVSVSVVFSNWTSSGSINAAISWTNGQSEIMKESLDSWTSKQFAFSLEL